jgi:hypothetical protein
MSPGGGGTRMASPPPRPLLGDRVGAGRGGGRRMALSPPPPLPGATGMRTGVTVSLVLLTGTSRNSQSLSSANVLFYETSHRIRCLLFLENYCNIS